MGSSGVLVQTPQHLQQERPHVWETFANSRPPVGKAPLVEHGLSLAREASLRSSEDINSPANATSDFGSGSRPSRAPLMEAGKGQLAALRMTIRDFVACV